MKTLSRARRIETPRRQDAKTEKLLISELASWRLGVFIFCALVAGCGTASQAVVTPARPVGEDLIALLPSGADLLVDVDLEQFRGWAPARRFVDLLPEDARARFQRLGFDPLADADALVTAVAGLGTPEPQTTTLVRGDVDVKAARASLGEPVSEADYHGTTIVEGPAGALARITPRVVAFGAPIDVRRVVDVAHSDSVSLRASPADRALLDAYARAPTARLGRPAVIAAALPTPILRERLRAEHLPGAELEWLAMSLAVGDGFDVVMVFGARGVPEAKALAGSMRESLQKFMGTTAVRLLGLRQFLEPIVIKPRESEVRLAARMSEGIVSQMLERLESVHAMQKPRVEGKHE